MPRLQLKVDERARKPLSVFALKNWPYLASVVLGVICLVLATVTLTMGKALQSLQSELQTQQVEINKGSTSQQVGNSLLRDIASAATKNDKLRALLSRNGMTLSETPAASPTPAP